MSTAEKVLMDQLRELQVEHAGKLREAARQLNDAARELANAKSVIAKYEALIEAGARIAVFA